MTNRVRFNGFILLVLMLVVGLVLVSLFFQAMTWAPWLLSSVSWNA